MIIYKKDIIKLFIVVIVIIGLILALSKISKTSMKSFHIGGFTHKNYKANEEVEPIKPVLGLNYELNEERFQRPSKQPALDLKYNIKSSTDFGRWSEKESKIPYTSKGFPEKYKFSGDVIQAINSAQTPW